MTLSSKYKIQGDLNRIWFRYYTKPISTEKRIKIADAFIKRYCTDSTETDAAIIARTKRKPQFHSAIRSHSYNPHELILSHPQFSQKGANKRIKQPLAEILSDFILRAEMDETGTIKGRETEQHYEEKHKEHNLYFFDGELDEEAGEKMPKGYITEYEAVMKMDKPRKPVTDGQVREELEHVKEFAEFYATTFHEEYDKEYGDSLRRIKRLDLSRVRTCEECSDGFYMRDLRRKLCDRQHGIVNGGVRSIHSQCEINYKNNEEMWRNRLKRSKIVKVSPTDFHY